MRRHQTGVTFLGWLVILIPVALLLYAAIRLTPVYLEYMKIARTLEQVSEQFKGNQVDGQSIRYAIERRFDIESVTAITVRDSDKLKISRQDDGYLVQVVYSDSVPFVGNVSLRVDFDKTVTVE
jgi:hypothetical protein